MCGTIVRLKGLKVYTHPKTGITYAYHRKTRMRIHGDIGSPQFVAEYSRLETLKQGKEPAPGTLDLAIEQYRRSPHWQRLRRKTRLSYERALKVLQPLAKVPLMAITRPY